MAFQVESPRSPITICPHTDCQCRFHDDSACSFIPATTTVASLHPFKPPLPCNCTRHTHIPTQGKGYPYHTWSRKRRIGRLSAHKYPQLALVDEKNKLCCFVRGNLPFACWYSSRATTVNGGLGNGAGSTATWQQRGRRIR